jgi:sulfite exporter TauE/SafE
LILLAVFVPTKYVARLTGAGLHGRIIDRLKSVWAKMFSRNTTGSLFVIGLLNGFLPCGLVYVALAASIATGGPIEGALYMAVFGLGTVPVMFAVTLFGRLIGATVRRRLKQVIPIGAVLLAAIFILRGLSLGIPLISPKLKVDTQQQAVMECCHPQETPDAAVDTAAQTPVE